MKNDLNEGDFVENLIERIQNSEDDLLHTLCCNRSVKEITADEIIDLLAIFKQFDDLTPPMAVYPEGEYVCFRIEDLNKKETIKALRIIKGKAIKFEVI